MPGARSILAVVCPRGSSVYQHQNPTARLLTPKDGGSFILVILINVNHQVDLRSLHGPRFTFKILCKMKPGDYCLKYM